MKTKDLKQFKGVDIPGYHLAGGGFFAERGEEWLEPPNWARNIVTHAVT